jgi:hypothetical protein
MGSLRRAELARKRLVNTYLLYIYDRRSTAPKLEVITVADDIRARELAAQRMAARTDYYGAEVWEDDRLVCKLYGSSEPA